eukprot:g75878.t1
MYVCRVRLRLAQYSANGGSNLANGVNVNKRTVYTPPEGDGGKVLFSEQTGNLSQQLVQQFQERFRSSPKNILAQNTASRNPLSEIAVDRNVLMGTNHIFNVKVEKEGKATSQSASGRCWLFAALNVMRLPFMKTYKLDSDFEFSQSYLFFWDKFEKANFFLEAVCHTADLPVEGRLFSYLLKKPVQDGGQWDMIVNIIEKYGVVPKKAFPESSHSSSSKSMNWLLTYRLREFAQELREMCSNGSSKTEVRGRKEAMLEEIHRILVICLGTPPTSFDWEYYTKDKKYKVVRDLTPLRFYKEYIKTDVSKYVSLINDPRNEYYKLYTVDFLGNVVGGRSVRYLNVPIEVMKEETRRELESGRAVWFGCDVGKFFHREKQIMDTRLFDYANLFGTRMSMSKGDRLRYGESLMTHAMTFTGLHIRYADEPPEQQPEEPEIKEQNEKSSEKATSETIIEAAAAEQKATSTKAGEIIKWRVENSWGDKKGDKGYAVMTDCWFDEYMYQVVVPEQYLKAELTQCLTQEPMRLPAWDPMGSLASSLYFAISTAAAYQLYSLELLTQKVLPQLDIPPVSAVAGQVSLPASATEPIATRIHSSSISLISRSAPETDEDVERRIKRIKTRNDLELQEGQIEKLVGENKNIDKQIQSLEKKAKNEQEIKALQKQVKKIKQAREDVDIAKGPTADQLRFGATCFFFAFPFHPLLVYAIETVFFFWKPKQRNGQIRSGPLSILEDMCCTTYPMIRTLRAMT